MPEDAPEYRVPGPRALTPQERAFRRWVDGGGATCIADAVESGHDLPAMLSRVAWEAFAAGWSARGDDPYPPIPTI